MLDLRRPRDASMIVSTAFRTWWEHLGVFIALAALPVVPTVLLLDGVWVGKFGDWHESGSLAAALVAAFFPTFVVTPLVTALHVLVVLHLARGEAPTVRSALREVVPLAPRAIAAVLLYTLAICVGAVLLFVPGIYVSVRWYFAAQAAVVDRVGPVAAIERSGSATADAWWRTLGILLLVGIVSAALALPLGYATQIVGVASGSGPLYVIGEAIAQTVTLSFTALAGTILFFDLRFRREGVAAVPAPAAA